MSVFSTFEAATRPTLTRAALVAGPGLSKANAELERIAPSYGEASILIDPECTRIAVREAFAAADVLHIASHARFRSDNPLFSVLEVADGPLFVHELETLPSVPSVVVLAACDTAAVADTGLDFTGFVSTLLALGARTVIAAVTPVPDTKETSDVMAAFHANLADGRRPSEALAAARSVTPDSPLGTLAANTFQVFGWG